MGFTNLPPTFFDTIKALENRIAKLETFGQISKAYSTAAGTITITGIVANTPKSATVILPTNRFTQPPVVTVTPYTVAPGTVVLGTAASSVTKSSFLAWVTRTTTTDTLVSWTAVQMSATNAEG